MGIAEAFADDVTASEFLEDHLEDLIEPHAELYEKVSDVDLVLHLVLSGEGGGEWTLVVSDLGIDVEDGRNSTAVATILGNAEHWPAIRGPLGTLFEVANGILERHADDEIPQDKRFTNARLNRLEGVRGSVRVELRDVESVGTTSLDVVFNGDSPAASPLNCSVSLADLVEVAEKGQRVKSLVDDGRIKVGGDMGLSVKLMAALA